jgi:hypothetical protein
MFCFSLQLLLETFLSEITSNTYQAIVFLWLDLSDICIDSAVFIRILIANFRENHYSGSEAVP